MTLAIKVENLWKEYRLGVIGHGTLTKDIQTWIAKKKGENDPNLKINSKRAISKSQVEGDTFSALRGLSFEVEKGEVLGIIGKNGSGKSTLLKIISRITAPTRGVINIKGRISSLLEVGTGFHKELTGRENIYLNGAILGMTKVEIDQKIDEIIEFSGIAHHIDTPVKRYSSGMYVRLAFAVAGHLEPEILIVDEVLAVGDMAFQKKCIGKMESISKQGRTILFVSHNLSVIKTLCPKTIVLSEGEIKYFGQTEQAIQYYLSEGINRDDKRNIIWSEDDAPGENKMKLMGVKVVQSDKNRLEKFYDAQLPIRIEVKFKTFEKLRGMRLLLTLLTQDGITAFVSSSEKSEGYQEHLETGEYTSVCTIPGKLLNTETYILRINAEIAGVESLVDAIDVLSMTFEMPSSGKVKWPGVISPRLDWSEIETLR